MATDVKTPAAPATPASTQAACGPRYLALHISCWTVAVALGAWQAWSTRFAMNPDGVSYLDIGDAYWRGDWHNAINAYWSPLYSWIVGFFLKVFRPSVYWEYPLVHLVNFLIYVGTLACFEFFLSTFVGNEEEPSRDLRVHGEMALSPTLWYLVGYSLFIWTSLVLVGLRVVSPDMLVFASICLLSGLLVRARQNPSKSNFAYIGTVLGFGFLAKSVLLPLGIVFLVVAALCTKTWRYALIGAAIFLAISAPFVMAISHRMHRFTFGESGRITYAAYISNLQPWYPGDGGDFYPDGIGHAENIDRRSTFSNQLKHPAILIFDHPQTYSFDGPIAGTYPFWYDVAYWQDGIRPFFRLDRELSVIRYAAEYLLVLAAGIYYQLIVTVSLLLLFLLAPRPSACISRAFESWNLLVPVFVGVSMYAVVHFEYRYVAPLLCIGWITLFSGVRLPASTGLRLLMRLVIAEVACSQVMFAANMITHEARANELGFEYATAADALRASGVRAGAKVALVSDEAWGQGGPFVARLARLRIVAQVNSPDEFWSAEPLAQARVLQAFAAAGADVVLSWTTEDVRTDWPQLGNTRYRIRRLLP
jgi:hypothetical protein